MLRKQNFERSRKELLDEKNGRTSDCFLIEEVSALAFVAEFQVLHRS